MSVFVANKVLIFSDLSLYRGNNTLPPPLLALAGWVSSRPIFLFFLFFFCKILWFFKFRFSTEFWAFSRILYLLLILHKFSRYSFSLIFVRYGAFYVALRYSLSPSYFERLRIQFSSYLRLFSFFAEKQGCSLILGSFLLYTDCSFVWYWYGVDAKPFFLGDEYIVYYIQGLTSPTTAARKGTMVYLRVIIIWELL